MREASRTRPYRRTIRPNRSLTKPAALWLCSGLTIGGLALCAGALYVGAWPVLPFVAAELLGIGCVGRLIRLHWRDYERVRIDETTVDIARRSGKQHTRASFQRYWTRVQLERRGRLHPPRVLIGSHGRRIEVGAALTDEAREVLADDLKRELAR